MGQFFMSPQGQFRMSLDTELEIVVGDVVIRAGVGADEGQLTRAIRAVRAAAP